jgi:hypothetical protein
LQRCGRTGAQQPRTNIARADRVIVKKDTLPVRMSEIQEAATREINEHIYLVPAGVFRPVMAAALAHAATEVILK